MALSLLFMFTTPYIKSAGPASVQMEAHERERVRGLWLIGKLWNSLSRLRAARNSVAPRSAPIFTLSTITAPDKRVGRENRAIKSSRRKVSMPKEILSKDQVKQSKRSGFSSRCAWDAGKRLSFMSASFG
jgi:hypothetical protein